MSNYLIMTGGSRGIGEKTIEYFLQQGWKALNIARSTCNIPGVINHQIDLSAAATISGHQDALLDSIADATSVCLVHNAAHYKMDSIQAMSLEHLRHTLEVNLISSVALNNIFISAMPANSSIIYLGSTLAEKAVPGSASYIISKHAIMGLMRATCQDLAGLGIRTCCICPGLVDTQLLNETMDPATIDYLIKSKIIGKRLIEPVEIAKTIYFCATSNVLNGATIHANLGHLAD